MKSPIFAYLQKLHARYASLTEGKVADYIPQLAKAAPDWFGICIATRDGHIYEVGHTRQEFTIQSISKALSYGLALEDRGEEHVLSRIGVEPSGEAFNAISLKPGSGRPFNPMINAGAIATCGQILPREGQTRIQRISQYLSRCAVETLEVDEEVYRSESETGHRNRAIGWMLRNFGILDEDPHEILETYFQQCALRVTCADLAVMGATLANRGVNPTTGERAIAQEYVDNVLGVMATCGMYDWSGEWIYRVGLPAKSGVGGGILAVLPGQLGIGVFSPPLDAQGNSVRGIRVCMDMAQELALHLFNPSAAPQPAVRLSYNSTQVASHRRLPPAALQAVRRYGDRIRVLELQGPLFFSTVEPVIRNLVRQAPYCRHVLINFRHVVSIDAVSFRLLGEMREQLSNANVGLLCCHAGRFTASLVKAGVPENCMFDSSDGALEACENLLLHDVIGDSWLEPQPVPLRRCTLFVDCDDNDLAVLQEKMPSRDYSAGQTIIARGSRADELFIIIAGSVEVCLIKEGSPVPQRIDVLSAGMSFGEMAFIDDVARSADVMALESVTCHVMDRDLFNELDQRRPGVKIKILTQLTRLLSSRLRQANSEISALRS
jgi:glutaminase